ncbi:MAG TPA: hypothetical protein VIC53_09385, partial [Wenzhouxiangella sp.]
MLALSLLDRAYPNPIKPQTIGLGVWLDPPKAPTHSQQTKRQSSYDVQSAPMLSRQSLQIEPSQDESVC